LFAISTHRLPVAKVALDIDIRGTDVHHQPAQAACSLTVNMPYSLVHCVNSPIKSESDSDTALFICSEIRNPHQHLRHLQLLPRASCHLATEFLLLASCSTAALEMGPGDNTAAVSIHEPPCGPPQAMAPVKVPLQQQSLLFLFASFFDVSNIHCLTTLTKDGNFLYPCVLLVSLIVGHKDAE